MIIRKLERDDLPQLALLYKCYWNEDSDVKTMEEIFKISKGYKKRYKEDLFL